MKQPPYRTPVVPALLAALLGSLPPGTVRAQAFDAPAAPAPASPTNPVSTGAVAVEASPALRVGLRENGVGAILGLDGLNPLTLPPVEVRRVERGGKIVYSGSPEYCPGPGILYADTFSEGTPVRLYIYHVNASPAPLRFSIVLEPVGGPARVDVENAIVTGPSTNYFFVGRLSSFIQMGRPRPREPRVVRVSGPTLLDADLDARVVWPGRPEPLIHTLYDLRVAKGTVRVSVVAVAADPPTLDQYSMLSPLPRDKNHDRGTYAANTIDIALTEPYRTTDGVRHLRLADGKQDPFVTGADALTGQPGRYRGNYGVVYRVYLRLESPDGRRVALALNPRAGALGGAVASYIPKRGKSAHYCPALGLGPVKANTDLVILGRWDPKETPEARVEWTPPGAASLPVEWLLIPYEGPEAAASDIRPQWSDMLE